MWLVQAKFTVGVSAVLLNESDNVLLVRHRFRENEGWELPGGFIERDEGLEDALRRELYEETGFDVKILSLLSTHVGDSRHVDIRFLARVVKGDLTVDRSEVVEARFFPYSELSKILNRDQVRNIDLALERTK